MWAVLTHYVARTACIADRTRYIHSKHDSVVTQTFGTPRRGGMVSRHILLTVYVQQADALIGYVRASCLDQFI